MVDASASLYREGFDKELDFIKQVVQRFGKLSDDGLRIGVVVYSSTATLRIKFNDFSRVDDLLRAIDNLPYDEAMTRIDLGLMEAKKMFDVKNGARPVSKKVIL